jgi:hypothetical protein
MTIPSDPDTLLTRDRFAAALTEAGFPYPQKHWPRERLGVAVLLSKSSGRAPSINGEPASHGRRVA